MLLSFFDLSVSASLFVLGCIAFRASDTGWMFVISSIFLLAAIRLATRVVLKGE